MQMMDLINFDSRKRADTIIKKMKFELSRSKNDGTKNI